MKNEAHFSHFLVGLNKLFWKPLEGRWQLIPKSLNKSEFYSSRFFSFLIG